MQFIYLFIYLFIYFQNIPLLTGRWTAAALCEVLAAKTLMEILGDREKITKMLSVRNHHIVQLVKDVCLHEDGNASPNSIVLHNTLKAILNLLTVHETLMSVLKA